MKYTDEFFSLRCAGDILNVTGSVNNGTKEITEAMAMVSQIRSLALANKMEYTVVDLCAGNCLTSLVAVFLLPVKKVVAVDIRQPKITYAEVRRFRYVQQDIFASMEWMWHELGTTILVSCHPCTTLANRVVELYKQYDNIEHLIMMPCCVASVPESYRLEGVSKYDLFSLYLANQVNGRVHKDKHCLSPCNNVVVANKG